MLTRTKLRALSPGQWARVIVPDYDRWKERGYGARAGDEVNICIIPNFRPRYDSETGFHWTYRVAYRKDDSAYPTYESPRGGWISTWDFGLEEGTKYHYDSKEQRDIWDGKGRFLYKPASDDPELCPGPDYSTYTCSLCSKVVKPFSNDQGDLVCPWCEVTGLVLMDDEQLDRLEQVREVARAMGLQHQLERQLDHLDGCYAGKGNQCCLGYDFAPHSFAFAMFRPGPGETRKFIYNGGLIYQGPSCPGDGSFPSLSVSLASGTGWFCHT
jgi:hypothetical protein